MSKVVGGCMRLLFEMDTKNYNINGKGFIRPSSRCIHIKDGLVAMVYSQKYDYYKFPGGGIEKNEDRIDALIRETREEVGLQIIRESIIEYGYVHRIQKYDSGVADYFLQDNYYYLCDVLDEMSIQSLDVYEAEEGFTLEYVAFDKVIAINRNHPHGNTDQIMLERDARVLELLRDEGFFKII